MNYFYQFSPVLYIMGWFAAVFGASYVINWLLLRSIIRKVYRFFVAPGVVVHELSHAVGCLITGAEIIEINFWKASGGHVKHYHPKFRIVGEAIIALAPIWGTLAVLAMLTYFLVPDLAKQAYFIDLSIPANIRYIDLTDWRVWLYLYLVTSLLATMAPSKTDMRYAFASLVSLFAVSTVTLFFFPSLSRWLTLGLQGALPFFVFTLFLLACALTVSVVLALPNYGKHFAVREQID